LKEAYQQNRDYIRQGYDKLREANPNSYLAGEVGGTLATAAIPGMGASKALTTAGRLGTAAAQGAVMGLGQSEADLLEGELGQAAKDVALSGGINAATAGLGEKVVSPLLSRATGKVDDVIQRVVSDPNSRLNKGLAKGVSFLTGADETAALRQLQRPSQTAAAESDDFIRRVSKKAVDETSEKGASLGKAVGEAGKEFKEHYGEESFRQGQKQLVGQIDDFLEANKPSPKGFSALRPAEQQELAALSATLKKGRLTGDDLFNFRRELDHVEKLAGKYDQEGNGPFINFLKQLRHNADSIVDATDENLNAANKAYAQFKGDTDTLRGAKNEAQSESLFANLYGQNKGFKQEAAARLLKPDTLEGIKDFAANKSFSHATRPGGDNYFRRGALAAMTAGTSELVTNPTIGKKALRGAGRLQQVLKESPDSFGKFGSSLKKAAERGNTALAATHFTLSQTYPEYRQMTQDLEGGDDDETSVEESGTGGLDGARYSR